MILDKIVKATKIRIEKSKLSYPLEQLKKDTEKINYNEPFLFQKALGKKEISFICEVKKASPSKGIISKNFDYKKIAHDYEKAGADAISVLTEPDFFLGDINYLKDIKNTVDIPVLRKDFIIDAYQIYEAKVYNADAILLICSILNEKQITEYISIASHFGISCLVEAHDEDEVKKALKCGAQIIGVNNRNLKTFEVNINNSTNLRKLVPEDKIFVSESGIKTREDIEVLIKNNVNAVLIGEELMKSDNKKAKLDMLRGF